MLRRLIENIVDLILPRRCLKCGKILDRVGYLCDKCVDEINFVTPPYCQRCGNPLHDENSQFCAGCAGGKKRFYRLARSAMAYDDASKNLIIAFKFFDRTENANLLAAMMKVAGKDIFAAGVDMIVPVPLHYTRLIKRRYNQSSLLAEKLSRMTDIPVENFALIRHRNTRPQVEFSGRNRVINVKNAFSVKRPELVRDKRIVLIDDVMTTGSTLKESALALKRAGAKSVDVLTAARVI